MNLAHTGPGHRYALPRPEGLRCLVIAAGSKTISRLRSGSVHKIFPSALPGGSSKTSSGSGSFSILDCVYYEPQQTFYVMDMMCWKVRHVAGCHATITISSSTPRFTEPANSPMVPLCRATLYMTVQQSSDYFGQETSLRSQTQDIHPQTTTAIHFCPCLRTNVRQVRINFGSDIAQ